MQNEKIKVNDWREIDKNSYPTPMWIVEWSHPDLGIVEGYHVVYEPAKDTGWNRTHWVCPTDRGADIHIDEFTHYRKIYHAPSPIMTDSDHEAGKMSLDECKDKVAQEYGYENWQSRHDKRGMITEQMLDKIALLYASQLSPDADRYKNLEEDYDKVVKVLNKLLIEKHASDCVRTNDMEYATSNMNTLREEAGLSIDK